MRNYWTGMRRGNGGFPRNRAIFYLTLTLVMLTLNGCTSDDDDCDAPPPIFVEQITSDIEADGDIGLTPDATYTISSALDTGNILAGVDPVTGEEFRGFIDFPLRGSHGIPRHATIEEATLEVFINWMSDSPPDRIFPFIIDLVAFQPPFLIEEDFSRVLQPPLLTMPVDFYPSDLGAIVVIDVTALMDEAQLEGLPDFQVRLLLDFSAASGLIEIDDSDFETAPLLTVSYF